MLRINENRFKQLIVEHSFETDQGSVVKIGDLFDALHSLQCKAEDCDNECRYDSGYCSLCDMKLNSSKGKRITHPE
jgi:hypothetical protein